MNVATLIKSSLRAVYVDLHKISKVKVQPKGRLPKEEQIRCSLYAALKPKVRFIQAEASYTDIDRPSRKTKECDLHLITKSGEHVWIEIKRTWEARRSGKMRTKFINKISEQKKGWRKDLKQLKCRKGRQFKVFTLVSFTERNIDAEKTELCRTIDSIAKGKKTVTETSRRFDWPGTTVQWLKVQALIWR